jgi:hypothetical protein
MQNLAYILIVGLAFVLTLKAGAVVLSVLLPLLLLALVLAAPVAVTLGAGWAWMRLRRREGRVAS